jgi:hypothetical protein
MNIYYRLLGNGREKFALIMTEPVGYHNDVVARGEVVFIPLVKSSAI